MKKVLSLMFAVLLLCSTVQAQDRAQHRADCLKALTDLANCWVNSTDEEKELIVTVIEAIYNADPPGGDDPPPPPPVGAPNAVGIQASSLFDFYPLRPWANIMHGSGEWKQTGKPVLAATDANGEPTEPATCSIKSSGFAIPEGPYVLAYTGGTCTLSGAGVTNNADGTYSMGEGSVLLTSDGNARGITLTHVAGGTFLEETVAPLRGNVGVFRTMSLSRVNESGAVLDGEMSELFTQLAEAGVAIPVDQQTPATFLRYSNKRWEPTWQSRVRASHSRYSGKGGVPWEALVELAQELRAHTLWVCQPMHGVQATDEDYARNLGAFLATAWEGPIVFEAGNEWWHDPFTSTKHAKQRGPTLEDAVANIQAECWAAFKAGYVGASGNAANLEWAVMGWITNPDFITKVLAAIPGETPDVVGCSFYLTAVPAFSQWRAMGQQDPSFSSLTPEGMIATVDDLAFDTCITGLSRHAQAAASVGAVPGAYEGMLAFQLGNLSNIPALDRKVYQAVSTPEAAALFQRVVDGGLSLEYKYMAVFSWMHNEQVSKDGVFGLWADHRTPRPTADTYLQYHEN